MRVVAGDMLLSWPVERQRVRNSDVGIEEDGQRIQRQ
jgi:hypothetical protein